ncbi:uncharacterized protein BO88DRAFT_55260 [Aspergillus vadensis CBS 113365]|uniref:Uncharacterized protein n=1 Tax=Aspergillus vadensis (strain CBS 113365 / IMI 142717 / IBT 24658) TaxID=1448311 RepID=A0A319BDX5_ASPVC|nr:hypothetical protein BO88DRAFT_55260 [Aspergillus vadensis CBS 113365]PYH68970.1 hypothetical protein BO88DRAFT_55260 [Aspergillus vadensis CBS 113365]
MSITEAAPDDGVAVTGAVQDNRVLANRMAALRISQPLLTPQQPLQHLSGELRPSEISVHEISWFTADRAKQQMRHPLKDVLRRARGLLKIVIILTAYFCNAFPAQCGVLYATRLRLHAPIVIVEGAQQANRALPPH